MMLKNIVEEKYGQRAQTQRIIYCLSLTYCNIYVKMFGVHNQVDKLN